MSHENQGLRISGNVWLQRHADTEQPIIGPLAAEYIGATAQSDRKTVLDPRSGRRGQVLFAVTDPKEPSGKLILLSCPPKVLAFGFLGEETTDTQASGTVAGERHAFVEDFGIALDYRNVGSVAVTPGVKASLATGTEGNNNAITWTAVSPGTEGNSITVALVDPSGNNQALAVAVTGTAITVSLATGVGGAITSTAAQVRAAVAASSAAAALVTTANTGASTGAAAVVAAASAPLASGSTAGTAYTVDEDYEVLSASEGIVRPLAGGAMGASGECFVAYHYGAISGVAVNFGTDVSLRARVILEGVNDTDANAAPTRYVIEDALLSPSGEINLIGADPVKVELSLVPLTPAGSTTPITMSFPVLGSVA